VQEARRYLRQVCDRLHREGLQARGIVEGASPAAAILDVARRERPDLIAMATHGRTGSDRLLFGSVAEQMFRSSPSPLLLVRPFWLRGGEARSPAEDAPVRNILVPWDGREGSVAIVPPIAEFAKMWDAHVVLFDVTERIPGSGGETRIDESLSRIEEGFRSAGVVTLRLADAGEVEPRVFEIHQSQDIDMIALGVPTSAPVSRFSIGGLAERLLRDAQVPLFAVPAPLLGSEARPWPRAGAARSAAPFRPSRRPARTRRQRAAAPRRRIQSRAPRRATRRRG
jgi:nucleotide-binding universal stress UspA family protein